MTVNQFAKKVKRSRIRVYQLIKDGRIEGARIDELGNHDIPDNATLPVKLRPGRKTKRVKK